MEMVESTVTGEEGWLGGIRSIYSILHDAESHNTSFPIIIYHGKHVTYHSLLSMADSMAETLRKKFSVKKGDRIGIALPLSPQFMVTFFAAMKIGAVAVPMDHLLTTWEMENVIHFTGIKVLVAVYTADITVKQESGISGIILTRLQEFLPFEKAVSVTAGQIAKSVKLATTGVTTAWFSEMIFEPRGEEEQVDLDADPAVMFVFPSIDGDLRGITYSGSNLLNSIAGMRENLRIPKRRFRIASSTPVFSPSGFQLSVMLPAVLGGTVICAYERNDYERLARLCSLFDCDYVCGMPNDIYSMADENVPLQGSKSLKGALCPSYLMNDGIRSMFQEKFKVPVLEYYDVPEMTGITHMQPADRNQIRQGSVGRPLRGVTQKIVDEVTGEDLEHGKVGLLLLGGNQITRGYFPAEGTEGNFSGNMLKTGDMARIDEDGYLYVTDYHREFLISRDVIVSPGEIEKFLSQVEGVSEAAVIGLDTGQGDQKIVAVVVPASGKDVSIDRLREACESRLSKEKVPAEFYLRDSMPKSISGRTLKRILIEEQTLKK
jgi:long-chain acyl-CoA synthetase